MASPIFELSGIQVTPPENWQDVQMLMTWDNESVQANITTTDFTFVGDGARLLKSWVDGGLNGSSLGYFQGMPVKIKIVEGSNSANVFNGHTNFVAGYSEITPNDTNLTFKAEVQLRQDDQIISFKERAAGTSFQLISDAGLLTNYEWLLYVIQKPFDALEVISLAIQEAMLVLSEISLINSAAKDTTTAVALLGTAGIGSPIASASYLIAVLVLDAISALATLVEMVVIINKMLSILLPMPKKVKVLSLRTLAVAACKYLGFDFASSIPELDRWYILPSKNKIITNNPFANDLDATGFFNPNDYGYIAGDLFKQMEIIFRAKFQINGTNVNFESLNNDSFWLSTANYTLPNVFQTKKKFNGEDLNGELLIRFSQDNLDEWTRQNYTGTVYEVRTTHAVPGTEPYQNLIKGLDYVDVKWALGNPKNSLNFVEKILVEISVLINAIAAVFNQTPPSFTQAYQSINKALKISQDQLQVPKLLSLEKTNILGSNYLTIIANDRDDLSARAIWNKYVSDKSFVSNNYRNQWTIIEDIRIPFGFSDFQKLQKNNYFLDSNGNACRMDKIEWTMSKDYAVCSYRIRKPFDKNLIETYNEGNG